MQPGIASAEERQIDLRIAFYLIKEADSCTELRLTGSLMGDNQNVYQHLLYLWVALIVTVDSVARDNRWTFRLATPPNPPANADNRNHNPRPPMSKKRKENSIRAQPGFEPSQENQNHWSHSQELIKDLPGACHNQDIWDVQAEKPEATIIPLDHWALRFLTLM